MDRKVSMKVLHSGHERLAAAVIREAERSGFQGRALRLNKWFEKEVAEQCDVLVLDMEAASEKDAAACVADSGIPLLCIRTPASVKWPTDYCSMTVDWPEQKGEVQAALSQLSRSSRPTPITLPAHDLSQELSPLGILGRSEPFIEVFRRIKKFAFSLAPVLICGETGTGKELAARALHYFGSRWEKPFIPVNCGAYPDGLIENELFGHEKGAFTDAKFSQLGLIAQAEGGSLFLDEIDSLSSKAQVTLLRFLQDQHYRPLGGSTLNKSNVSVIVATNADLDKLTETNGFRKDLYYRLNVVRLHMPPLRDRIEDIPILARYFLRYFSDLYGTRPKYFEPGSLLQLQSMKWPGNVRELENFVHRAFLSSEGSVVRTMRPGVVQSPSPLVRLDDLHLELTYKTIRTKVVNDFERQYLHRLMANTQGNVTHAARIAGKERRSLGRLLKKHGIDRRSYRFQSA